MFQRILSRIHHPVKSRLTIKHTYISSRTIMTKLTSDEEKAIREDIQKKLDESRSEINKQKRKEIFIKRMGYGLMTLFLVHSVLYGYAKKMGIFDQKDAEEGVINTEIRKKIISSAAMDVLQNSEHVKNQAESQISELEAQYETTPEMPNPDEVKIYRVSNPYDLMRGKNNNNK